MDAFTSTKPDGRNADGKRDIIDEEGIGLLVDSFYTKVRADPELGPVFDNAIGDGWGPHLQTMRNFWSSLMLGSGRYKGNPLAVHLAVKGIAPPLFERWLALFTETCGELFDEEIGEAFSIKANRIAESFQLALFYRPDRPWPMRSP